MTEDAVQLRQFVDTSSGVMDNALVGAGHWLFIGHFHAGRHFHGPTKRRTKKRCCKLS